MPIDDLSEVNLLMQALERALPLRMLVTPPLRATLASQGLRIDMDQPAVVENLFYGGDEGGVLCGPRLHGVEDAVIVSITHLQPETDHPLAPVIIAYQRRRVAGIAKQHLRPPTQRSSRKTKRR